MPKMVTYRLHLVLLALTLGLEMSIAHRNTCRYMSRQRCLQELVLSLKQQQSSLIEELRSTKEQLRSTKDQLEELLRSSEKSLEEKIMLVDQKAGDATSIAHDACIRNWYCDTEVTQWATGVTGYSSQTSHYNNAANKILGMPNVYPAHGFINGQWIPDTLPTGPWDTLEWIELEYVESLFANRVDVYETLNNGGVSKILYRNDPTEDWAELYSATGIVAVMESNILSVEPEGEAGPMKYIRLEISQSASQHSYIGYDAVSITGHRDCSMTCAGP